MAGLAPLRPVFEPPPDCPAGGSSPIDVIIGAGVNYRCADSGALEFHLQIGHHGDRAGFRGPVGAMCGRWRSATSDPTNMTSPR